MTDFLDANRKDTYAVFKLPKDELHHLIMGVYLDLDTTKQGQDSLINRTIVRNTMSALVNQINIYAINKIEQQNDSKNNLITSKMQLLATHSKIGALLLFIYLKAYSRNMMSESLQTLYL